MARATTWVNNDGLPIGFGAHDSRNDAAATVRTQGNVNILQSVFDYDFLPAAAGTAADPQNIPVPAGAVIKRAQIRVLDAFVGGTSLTIGTKQKDGTVIDADGIDAAVATAALTADAVIVCDGAQVDGDAVATDAFIAMTTAGTFTAGSFELLVEYIMPQPDTTPTDPISGIVGSL